MKAILSTILTTILVYSGYSQTTFVKIYDTYKYETIQDAEETSDGGFILTANAREEGSDTTNMLVIKTDEYGEIEWSKVFYRSEDAYASEIHQVSDGGYYLIYSQRHHDVYTYSHPEIMKLSNSGDSLWMTSFDDITYSSMNVNTIFTASDEVILSSGKHYIGSDPQFMILKMSADGSIAWEHHVPELDDIYIYYAENMCLWNDKLLLTWIPWPNGEINLTVIDTTGEVTADTTIENVEYPYSCATKDSGLALAFIYYSDSSYIISGHKIMKINSDLEIEWIKDYTDPDNAYQLFGCTVLDDNSIVTTTQINTHSYVINGNIKLTSTSADGDSIWQSTIENDGYLIPTDVSSLHDKRIVLAGIYNNTIDLYTSSGLLIVTDSTGTLPSSKITGNVFYDENDNLIRDAGDTGISGLLVKAEPGPMYGVTDTAGNYFINVYDSTEFQITSAQPEYFMQTFPPEPFYQSVSIDSFYFTIDSIDFAKNVIGDIRDLTIDLHGGGLVAGFPVEYCITTSNAGTNAADTYMVTLSYDERLHLDSLDIPYTDHTDSTITWELTDLDLFETRTFSVYMSLDPDPASIGDTLQLFAGISSAFPDETPENNSDTVRQIIYSAFDPNHKSVEPAGETDKGYIDPITKRLRYTIDFQNTGNYPATFITLIDTLDLHLDPTSLQTISASHNYSVVFNYPNIIQWRFDDIQLPDSTTDLLGSQGFLTFEVNILPDMPIGTTIENFADIYFDFNPPVRTNTVKNTLALPTAVTEITNTENIYLYPNPATDALYLNITDVKNISVNFYSITGELIRSVTEMKNNYIDISGLGSGIYFYELEKNKARLAANSFIKL